jgi:membrane-associated phospholipid phosphatase
VRLSPKHRPTLTNRRFRHDNGQATAFAVQTAMLACLLLIVLSVAWIDRPVADYAHAVLRAHEKDIYAPLTHIVDPIPVFAGLTTGAYAIAALFGHQPGPHGTSALRFALAVLVAIALKEQLKFLTGRTWPETWTNNNPSYIKDGVFGFFPLISWGTAGRAYHAFPSGHMTTITVAAVSLALTFPRWRLFFVLPVALVAIGLTGANYHWISDLIAGGFLGAAVAVAAHRLGHHSKLP